MNKKSAIKMKHNNTQDEKIASVIVFHLYLLYCKNMLVSTSSVLYQYNNTFNILIIGLLAIAYISLVFRTKILARFAHSPSFLVLLLIVIFFIISGLIHPNLFSLDGTSLPLVSDSLRQFIAYCLPLFVLTSSLNEVDSLLEKLQRYTIVLFIFATLGFVFFLQSQIIPDDYSMGYGYAVMPLSVIYLYKYQKKYSNVYLSLVIITTFYIFFAGSRGPILSIAASVIVFTIVGSRSSKRRMFEIILLVLMMPMLVLFYDELLQLAISILDAFNIPSRTLLLLKTGRAGYDAGRTEIHEFLLSKLNQSPIFGLGALGSEYNGYQAHGIYLDILVNFGYIVGSLLIVALAIKLVSIICLYWKTSLSVLLLILALMSLPRGFFAGGIWKEKELWMIFGLLMNRRLQRSIEMCKLRKSNVSKEKKLII